MYAMKEKLKLLRVELTDINRKQKAVIQELNDLDLKAKGDALLEQNAKRRSDG